MHEVSDEAFISVDVEISAPGVFYGFLDPGLGIEDSIFVEGRATFEGELLEEAFCEAVNRSDGCLVEVDECFFKAFLEEAFFL